MKIIITTQDRENYGAHTWNGEGQCPQHWKNKGGVDYVINDLSVEQAQNIEDNFDNLVGKHLNVSDEYFNTYVISYNIVENEELFEDDLTEIQLIDNGISCIENEYAGFARPIQNKERKYIQRDGEVEAVTVYFVTESGEKYTPEEIGEVIRQHNHAA
jgi:hypothetical protein